MSKLPALLWVALLCAAGPVAADPVYRYADDQGRVFFTDRADQVPVEFRDRVEQLGVGDSDGDRVSVIQGLDGAISPEAAAAADAQQAESDPRAALRTQLASLPDWSSLSGAQKAAMVGGLGVGLLLGLGLSLLLSGATLKWAARLAGEGPLGIGRAMLIALMMSIGGALIGGGTQLTVAAIGVPAGLGPLASGGLQLVASLLVYAAVLRGMHCESFGRALKLLAVWIGLILAVTLLLVGLGLLLAGLAG